MTQLAERFEQFLAVVEPQRRGQVLSCAGITGGYSRISARAQVRWADGGVNDYILRGDPPEGSGVFVSDRDAEWQLLRALSGVCGAPTPVARWYDATGEHLGSKCIVVDAADATSMQHLLAAADDPRPGMELFVDTFAAVHMTPLDALPLPRIVDPGTYLDDVLAGLAELGRTHPGCGPVLSYVAGWAAAHKPPPVPLGLVHGDCQLGNVLVSADGTPLVIDWEFAHIGDPREDLGYYTQIPMPPNVYRTDPEAFLARYRDRTGMNEDQVNPEVVEYFVILGMAKLLVQLLDAAAAIGSAQRPGILAAYLINAISHQHDMFLALCERLDREARA